MALFTNPYEKGGLVDPNLAMDIIKMMMMMKYMNQQQPQQQETLGTTPVPGRMNPMMTQQMGGRGLGDLAGGTNPQFIQMLLEMLQRQNNPRQNMFSGMGPRTTPY